MRRRYLSIWFTIAAMAVALNQVFSQETHETWPKRVLITNDNGIEDIKIIQLARAFSKITETWVVAPMQDKSGSTHYMPGVSKGELDTERRDLGQGIHAFAVDGFPADCVILALTGIMRENPPDLVISGINGGANLGMDWLGSGTIGAARIGAYAGFPALAVSGLDKYLPGAVDAASQWIVRLARSPVVQALNKGRYLTISLPRLRPHEIRGVRVARRSGALQTPVFETMQDATIKNGRERWRITGSDVWGEPLPTSDVALWEAGFIVVVPMRADEHDDTLISDLKSSLNLFPSWPSK